MQEDSNALIASVDAVLAWFGLGEARAAGQLQNGIANRSVRVLAGTGDEYVVKFLVYQKEELVVNELAIQQQLDACHIVTPRYIQSPSGGYIYRHEGRADFTAVVAPLIQGMHPSTLSRKLAYAMGNTLARFHAGVRSLPVAHTGWLNRKAARQAAVGVEQAAVAAVASAWLAEGDLLWAARLPVGIIHGDFHIGNLLVKSRTDASIVAMLDFEEAEQNLLLVDIAFGLFGSHSLAYTRRHTSMILHAFLDGYEAVRPLKPAENDHLALALRYVGCASALWMYEHDHAANAAHNIAIADFLCGIDLRR